MALSKMTLPHRALHLPLRKSPTQDSQRTESGRTTVSKHWSELQPLDGSAKLRHRLLVEAEDADALGRDSGTDAAAGQTLHLPVDLPDSLAEVALVLSRLQRTCLVYPRVLPPVCVGGEMVGAEAAQVSVQSTRRRRTRGRMLMHWSRLSALMVFLQEVRKKFASGCRRPMPLRAHASLRQHPRLRLMPNHPAKDFRLR